MFHRPLISYTPETCGALTDAQANKSSDSQSEDATPERLETVIERTAPQSKRLRLTLDARKQYHDQLRDKQITEADLKEKGLSHCQILSLKKAEPKPHKPHKAHKAHIVLPLDIRKQYHAQLRDGQITEADLKDKGLSDWQILSLKKTEPKPHKPPKAHIVLPLDIRKQYHAQLRDGQSQRKI